MKQFLVLLLVLLATLAAFAPIADGHHKPRHGQGVTDTVKPGAAFLSAVTDADRVVLSWLGATDNVGVVKYEIWRDSQFVASVSAGTFTYVASGGGNYRVVAYDAAGNYTNSNIVLVETAPPPPPPTMSRLTASGQSIADATGRILPPLKGFNVHVSPNFVWDQPHFDAQAVLGARVNRAILLWDQFEPTKGSISAAYLANLDAHVARAAAAGIYTMFELHLNTGNTPSWTHDRDGEMEQYAAYGATLTQALAARYGNNEAVIGFGLNEPPLEDGTLRNGPNAIPYLEAKQRQMISWFRAAAPKWIGFVAYGYASQTPYPASGTDADPNAFDAVGGNVVLDLHDYQIGCTTSDPNCDGRQYNGNIYPTFQGGTMLTTQGRGNYVSSELRRSQQRAYVAPYKTFTAAADIPLMIGEWGWPEGSSGEVAWITDKKAAWAGSALEIHWNYGTLAQHGVWAARLNGVWRPSVLAWLP